ncbi:hypothetical protein [Aquisphaera insulae]|uniref:hypothetical protein n=1 Tax=Aquisphaera insulae TaxID=2712864 RepID=UPI0013EDB89F|nr:hypothetical protein [Aquisphaera insulae]
MYVEYAAIRATSAFVGITSVTWADAAGAGVIRLLRSVKKRNSSWRALTGLLAVVAALGLLKVLHEVGPDEPTNLYMVASFLCPLAAGLVGLMATPSARVCAVLLGVISVGIWTFLTLQHFVRFHASLVFFDWSFILYGWLICALSIAAAISLLEDGWPPEDTDA